MKSRWYELKTKVLSRRQKGWSIGSIEKKFGIPRSTLSYWFKDIILTAKQRAVLIRKRDQALIKARKLAVLWHNKQKASRLAEAQSGAMQALKNIRTTDSDWLKITLAMLYLGEGFKTSVGLGLGNSDPLILKFFIAGLTKCYGYNINKIKCELHLRADQNINNIKRYWSRELKIPLHNFTTTSFDKRTTGVPTYRRYKGVCVLRGSAAHLQRELMFLGRMYIEKIAKMGA